MTEPMSEREIAKALGISRARVRHHIKRALKKMSANSSLREVVELARDTEHRKSVQECNGLR
jgi:DNA-binding CsgD family transcriptional regulator